jgi:hypothetical protein
LSERAGENDQEQAGACKKGANESMSWYKETVDNLMEKRLFDPEASKMPSAKLYAQARREFPVTITVTDMYNEQDKDKLTSALLALEGVSSVKPILHQKKLVVAFNPGQVSLQTITYTIAQLGYHYIQRS